MKSKNKDFFLMFISFKKGVRWLMHFSTIDIKNKFKDSLHPHTIIVYSAIKKNENIIFIKKGVRSPNYFQRISQKQLTAKRYRSLFQNKKKKCFFYYSLR